MQAEISDGVITSFISVVAGKAVPLRTDWAQVRCPNSNVEIVDISCLGKSREELDGKTLSLKGFAKRINGMVVTTPNSFPKDGNYDDVAYDIQISN